MFADVHRGIGQRIWDNRVQAAEFAEVLYADDTICISEDSEATNQRIRRIEVEGEKYGMKLNYGECEQHRLRQRGKDSDEGRHGIETHG